MKKAFVALAAVGTAVVLLVLARRVGHEMREHSKQMKAHCKQMAAHCKEMMASTNGCSGYRASARSRGRAASS